MKNSSIMLCGIASWFTLLSACTTPDNQVKQIDDHLEVKGHTEAGKVGVNKEGEAVIQTENTAVEELRLQQLANNELESNLREEHHLLKSCRQDINDPRLGGSGEFAEIPEVDNMKETTEVKEDIGLVDSGDFKVVKKESYNERLKKERQYEKTLKKMLSSVKTMREKCESKMAVARQKAGLPSDRYKATGYFTGDGVWVETRKGENSLDDAFEIKAKAQARANSKDETSSKEN